MQHEWILLALPVTGLQTFIKTGESSLNTLVPLRSTLNTGTLSFPSKFVRSLTLHLPTGVCLFSLLPSTGRYYLLHFLPSTISYSTDRGQVKSLLTVQKKSLPLKSEGFTSCSAAAMLCFLHLIYNGEEHVLDSSWNVIANGDAREENWRGNWRMEWVASTLHTTSEHGVSSITTNNKSWCVHLGCQ